ncbi:hypothetical protein Angca_009036 [Angiostrongylus cantonensis]|nr:hypothetical protein Angca_009036 [Angiostrongylus cantonensis]
MWIEVRRACETVQNFEDLESSTACSDLIKEIEKFKWRIQNILRNQGKSASDRAKLKADSEVVIDGVKVPVSQALCNEAFVISDIFNLNEMEALELVLSGESQKIHFDCLSRGLIAVVCYYDMHRLLAVILRMVLEWEKDSMSDVLRSFIEQNFVQRAVFQQLLQLQATFNVITEFHMLSQPNVCGLGGPRHQTLLRNVIEEIRENCAESLYSLCEWGSEHANEFLADIYPILKVFVFVPLAEKFSAHHLSAWMCLMKLTSSNVLSQTNSVAVVLTNLVKEIRNETLWSDQSVCGTVQLQCAVSLRALAVSPADHLSITNVEVDVDKVVDRAIRNMAMLFIRHGIVGADSFKLCATHVRVVDTLLKQLIALFPAKLMEIERNSEDELTWVDEMSEKGQQATPALYYENFLRCIPDLYRVVDDPEASAAVKTCVMELSTSYSSSGSLELCRFMERARLPHHVVHAVAYLDFLCSVCLTQQVSSFIFDIFARVPPNDDGCIGWDHVMSALRSYERLFRERSGVVSMFGHSLPTQQQSKADIPPRELIGLITWVNLARTVVDLDDEAAEVFLEERQWAVLDAALGVVSAPVPLLLKGALLRLVAALAKKESSALRIWNALNAHRLCTFAENGTLLGLQRELDERECVEEMFDTSLGFVSILRSLLSHPYIAVPDFAAPYLQYLTKSIVSQMASRSYKDIEQFYELEEISLSALLFLLKQSYVNSRAVLCKEPHVALLAQILNDTPVYRAICSVLIEDVNIQDQTARSYRRTSAPALPAIHLLSVAVSRYAVLRASIRASDSDMMLAPLHALLLSPLQPSGLNILDIVLLYIEEADDLPCHALYAARILRELCAIRPSLQSHMVELLRARKMVARNARAIRSVLNPSSIRYTVSDMVALEFDESDPVRMRGEAALVVLETLSDSVETDPAKNNLCFLLFGFKTTTDGSGQLYDVESQPTGFHQVLSILEQFVAAQNPLQLPFSALIEPSFRLLQRLVSIDSIHSQAVLRFIRSIDLIYQLLTSPFLSAAISKDDSEGPARLSVTRMISGSILHLTALEISSLLKTGHFNKPQEMYSALLEASEAVTCHQEELEAGVDNLLFSLLRHGRIELSEEIAYPRLVHFNAHRLHMLFDTCKTTTVFNIAQYDIEYLHVLLVREIVSTQAEDTTTVTREMEAVLTYGTDVNSQLLQRGASEQLVSGCTALLNVMALFAPVPFFSIASQLDMLTDAAFLLVEYVSGCGADEQVAVCTTLMRLCKAICRLASQRYSEKPQLRSALANLLNSLLELLIQPGERPLQAKISIYRSARICMRNAYVDTDKDKSSSNDNWLTNGIVVCGSTDQDPIVEVIHARSYELSQCITRDIVDLPDQHKSTPLLLLSDMLHEDPRTFASLISKTGVARYMTDFLASIAIDWTALSRHEPDAVQNHTQYKSLMIALARLSLTDSGWNALADLALPEVLAQLPLLQPPKQVFLQPASANEKDSPSELFVSSFEAVIRLCYAICAKPRWKRLSFKILDAVHSQSELLSQLMRAEIKCRMMDIVVALVQYIWEHDDLTREVIDQDSVLKELRIQPHVNDLDEKISHKPYSFVTPNRLYPECAR